ncbi:AIPR family protein [Clostridium gasigenes]|uniref:AIPR family protein n=1 Tax=Clostridium gasigenes TaxID=94869 RepID=UPI00143853C0|nr:AIPR family protein [Clostridium gasigenes]NKF07321.1 AIPR family protein [Clostridium gasigenes]QSW18294.1 AIPR family protein [Clostridium gasigenes]
MITAQMREFNEELIEEVRADAFKNNISGEDAFTNIFASYIVDAGESYLSNCNISAYQKTNEKMKINGYTYDEYFQTLTLVISDFNNRKEIKKIGKTEIEKMVRLATKFFRNCKTDYFMNIEESSDGYLIYEYIKENLRNIENIKVILLTNKESARHIPEDIRIDNMIVKFDVWDLERVCQYIYQNKIEEDLIIRLQKKYNYDLQMIKVEQKNDTYECYIGVIPGQYLASIYKDEGQRLIEKNVRSFLQATGKINKGLKETLTKDPEMFMAYNNGISTIAEELITDEHNSSENIIIIKELKNWQIVNGGQTTASIYNALQNKVSLENVNVQMKLTVIKDKNKYNEIISNISKYANSQNKINMSDFSANEEYHIEMERLSRKTYVPSEKGKSNNKWFYERARGQYMVELNRQPTIGAKKQFKEMNPKKQCISKTVAAKCQMAWMKYPDVVSKGLETNFIKFSEMVKNNDVETPSEISYISMIAKVILFQACDKIVENLRLGGYKAQVNYYTLAVLSEFHREHVQDEQIWRNQTISQELELTIEEVALKVWEHFMKPEVKGINIGQWCKKEDCWKLLKNRYKNNLL